MRDVVATSALLLLAPMAAAEVSTVFDFEGLPASSGVGVGELSVLDLSQEGIGLAISREDGIAFDVVDVGSLFNPPASFGTRALDPFANRVGGGPGTGGAFVFAFDIALTSFSIDFGNGAGGTATLEAFSDASLTTLVSTATETGGLFPNVSTLTVAGEFQYLRITSTHPTNPLGDEENVFYLDNIAVTAIPTPNASLALVMGGLLAARRRR